jgi:flagellar assembly factor FliW
MRVTSSRFGEMDVRDDAPIDFGGGLLGFASSTSYVVVEIEDDDYYFWLQSVEEPEVAFLATVPWDFFPDYEIDVPDVVQEELGLDDPADSEIFLLLSVQLEGDQPVGITANLLGPIVVNKNLKRARQIVLDGARYSTQEPLVMS